MFVGKESRTIMTIALLCISLICMSPGYAYAEDSIPLCSSEEELVEAINEHGKAKFTCDITIKENDWSSLCYFTSDKFEDLYIYTGEYSLIINGYVYVSKNTTITGDGDNNPVVVINSSGSMMLLAPLTIESENDNAVTLETNDISNFGDNDNLVTIKAKGTDSTAVNAAFSSTTENNIIYTNLLIEADESGSTAFVSNENTRPIYFKLCKISGSKYGVKADTDIENVASAIYPENKDIYAYMIKPFWEEFDYTWTLSYDVRKYGYHIAVDDPWPSIAYKSNITIHLQGYYQSGAFFQESMEWLRADIKSKDIDYSTVGDYKMTAVPRLRQTGLPIPDLEYNKEYDIPVKIVPDGKQYITYAIKYMNYSAEPDCIYLYLMNTMNDSQELKLHVWEDGEKKEVLNSTNGAIQYADLYNGNFRTISYLAPDFSKEYRFQLEIVSDEGSEFTDKIDVPVALPFVGTGKGGDRDGGDQEMPGGPVNSPPSDDKTDGDNNNNKSGDTPKVESKKESPKKENSNKSSSAELNGINKVDDNNSDGESGRTRMNTVYAESTDTENNELIENEDLVASAQNSNTNSNTQPIAEKAVQNSLPYLIGAFVLILLILAGLLTKRRISGKR